jgi:hypothetical protein
MTFLEQSLKLFGKPYGAPEVIAFLSAQPPHTARKPADGRQYVVCRKGGFDLLFVDEDAAGRRPQNRVLQSIFLYASGVEKHDAFQGALPFGFLFADDRPALFRKRTPSRTWVLGEGPVSIDHGNPSIDVWLADDFQFSAHYLKGGQQVRHFTLSLPPKGD